MASLLSSRHLTLLGARVGATVGKALLATAVEGRLTPELLGEAIVSSSTLRSHVRAEALRLVAVRLSMRAPRHLQWLVRLVSAYLTHATPGQALRSLGQRTLLYHITAFGLRGTVASALAGAAVQAGVCTCWLASGHVRRRLRRRHNDNNDSNDNSNNNSNDKDDDAYGGGVPTMAQYRYDLTTIACTAASTVLGGGVGAAVGSLVAPGFGTALGSIVCSSGGGLLVGCVRERRAPAVRLRQQRRRQAAALRAIAPLQMRDVDDDFVEMHAPLRNNSSSSSSGGSDDKVVHDNDEDDDEDDEDEEAFVYFTDDGDDAGEADSGHTLDDDDDDDCVLLAATATTTTTGAEHEHGAPPATAAASRVHVMRSRVECLEGKTWSEVDDLVDALGDDEVVLLFCDDDALLAATTTRTDNDDADSTNDDKDDATAPTAAARM